MAASELAPSEIRAVESGRVESSRGTRFDLHRLPDFGLPTQVVRSSTRRFHSTVLCRINGQRAGWPAGRPANRQTDRPKGQPAGRPA